MSYLQACVLGLLQGLGEFLPISSSGHLALAPWLLGWQDPGLTFDVALHAGTLLATLAYFRRDWIALLGGAAIDPRGPQARMLLLLALACLPGALAGLLLEKAAEHSFRSPASIAALLIVFGLLLEAADRFGRRARSMDEMTWAAGLMIGAAQALALAPGVSRSGSTMTAALALGFTREAAARFSFLLSTPIVAGACLLKLRHLSGADLTGPFWAGVLTSAVSGLLAVGFLMKRLPAGGVTIYTAYRLVLGAAVLAVYFVRG